MLWYIIHDFSLIDSTLYDTCKKQIIVIISQRKQCARDCDTHSNVDSCFSGDCLYVGSDLSQRSILFPFCVTDVE